LSARADFEISSNRRILELGFGSVRMMRHLADFANKNEIWGIDVTAEFAYIVNRI
jgi:fibrillarin-like rRNA methylase